MTLLDEIIAKVPRALLDARDLDEIARLVSIGRTELVSTPIGYGAVLDALGPEAGAAVLDSLEQTGAHVPAVRWAVKLLDRSVLDIALPSTRGAVANLVPSVMTQAQCDVLLALAERPSSVERLAVEAALYEPDGTPKWQ